MRNKYPLLVLLFVVLSQACAAWCASSDPHSIIDGIQRKYRRLSGFTAPYTREVLSKSMALLGSQAQGELASGTVSFKPPYSLRFDQAEPSRELLLADEGTLWWYIPEKKQAHRYPADKFGKELRLLSDIFRGLDRVEKGFKARVVGRNNRGADLLELRPDPPWEEIDHIVLAVSDGYDIREIAIHNTLGGSTTFRIENLAVDEPFEPGFFEFAPPAGVELIEEGS
jgi:outer membrane lipoprotein carrier protein